MTEQTAFSLEGQIQEIAADQQKEPSLQERIQAILDRTDQPKAGEVAISSEEAVDRLRVILSELPEIHPVFEPSLRNDGTHEYTSTGSCDGSQTWNYRRTPAFHSKPSSWESIESIPEGARHHDN